MSEHPLLRLVKTVILPPADFWTLRGAHFVFSRLAMAAAMYMFWYMCQHELIGPWLGGVASVILSAILIAVPFMEAFGLRIASWHRGFGRAFFQGIWVLCVLATFGGHLYLVSSVSGKDRFETVAAEETAKALVEQGDALVSTGALETRLAGQEETVQRLMREHERVTAWRTPLAQAIASGASEPALRAVQIEISARRAARGEEPIQEDGRARGSSDCRGVCGETAEAIEHEIALVAEDLRAAEALRDQTNAEIQARIDAEARGERRQKIVEANEVANIETTTRNMRAFMETTQRLLRTVGLEIEAAATEEEANELAASASDVAFLLLITLVNLISWTNNAGHGGRAPAPQGGPIPLRPAGPGELPPQPERPSLPPPLRAPPPAPGPSGMVARASSGIPPEALDVRARPMGNGAPTPRPEPDREQLSALGSIAALRAKTRAMKGE